MNTTLLKNKTSNLVIKRFVGDILLFDFLKYVHCLKDCIINFNEVSIVVDIRKTELKIALADLNELALRLNLEFLNFKKVSLIIITSTPKQAAFSYFIKHKVENSRQEIVICSFYETAKKSLQKNNFLLSQ